MEKEVYSLKDCELVEMQEDTVRKVVVYEPETVPDCKFGQLFLCLEWNKDDTAMLISLEDGEFYSAERKHMIGVLKPELLPEKEKLQLSQLRLPDPDVPDYAKPSYYGYCFLEDGRYAAGVALYSVDESVRYCELQALYQHRVLICNREDFAIVEIVEQSYQFYNAKSPGVLHRGKEHWT